MKSYFIKTMTILSYFLKSKSAIFKKEWLDLRNAKSCQKSLLITKKKIMKVTFITVLQERRKGGPIQNREYKSQETNTITMWR